MKRIIEPLVSGIRDSSGQYVQNGLVYFYDAGTTTLTTVYQDSQLTEPHANPATLDSNGCLTAYSTEKIKIVVVNSAGSTVKTLDYLGTSDADVSAAAVNITAGSGLVSNTDGQLDVNVDGSTISILDDELKIADEGVGSDQIADTIADASSIERDGVTGKLKVKAGGITQAMRVALGQQISNSSGSFSTSSVAYTDVTNLSVTITTTGRPVLLMLQSEGSAGGRIGMDRGSDNASADVAFLRDGAIIASTRLITVATGASAVELKVPASSFSYVDVVAAGTYTYKVQVRISAAALVYVELVKLVAFEL